MSKEKFNAFFSSFASSDDDLNFQVAQDRLNTKLKAIPTGSFLLDEILGCGGYY